ncbi:Subtilase family protein [Halogeometricum rufum]|uniref:Subtilase family protein n=1 Tax=Halogeometricum rufum TaxID=553469 RepID=A0A1I6ISK3_9EURY|nr:S8 family serine peptidase [Halogeometricum rufum]SFR69724.1 Subtilase family protein [Halogeometricum rufum]
MENETRERRPDGVSAAERAYGQPVVVKFRDDVTIPYEDAVEDVVERRGIGPWSDVEAKFPGVSLRKLLRALDSKEITRLVRRATKADPTYRPPNLLTYFVAECPVGRDPLELARELEDWSTVETAYVPGEPIPASVTVQYQDDPFFTAQQFLEAAPTGIGAIVHPSARDTVATGAWAVPGGDGQGSTVRFVDIEHGWKFDHTDLNLTESALLAGENAPVLNPDDATEPAARVEAINHGTAVLGVVAGRDNDQAVLGVVPELDSVEAISAKNIADINEDDAGGLTDALLVAAKELRFGDVLLIELSPLLIDTSEGNYKLSPAEAQRHNFDAIRLCTALGIVVVEAAGNGIPGGDTGVDLDTLSSLLQIDGETPLVEVELNRDAPTFEDSGAILVGACKDPLFPAVSGARARADFSNYGSRIDCFAWGRDVTTLGVEGETPESVTDRVFTDFSGTSSASAIVAGAAVSVQSMAEANLGYRFSPRHLRQILSRRPAPGAAPGEGNTPSFDPTVDRIGVMPNLQWISEEVLNTEPDPFLRDHVGDTGDPHDHPTLWRSPDVFVRHDASADPQTEFGTGENVDSDSLGSLVVSGQDHYVYVRIDNRGPVDARDVTATVYYCEPSTLMWGHLWADNEIGTVTVSNVPADDETLTVAGPIEWDEADLPEAGHYCFVALIGSEADPAPEPTDFDTMENYRRFVSERNNVAWRNFNVVSNAPAAGFSFVRLPFFIAGGRRENVRTRLSIDAALPKGSRAFIQLPRENAAKMDEHLGGATVEGEDGDVRIPVNPHGRTTFGETTLPIGSRARATLLVDVPKEHRRGSFEVSARQLYGDEEVGRVTWRLAPETSA